MLQKKFILLGLIIFIVIGIGYYYRAQLLPVIFQPTSSPIPTGIQQSTNIEEIASNLETPWAIAQLPDGDLLVTERSGRLQRIGQNGQTHNISGVEETSEGGLLGVAIHPNFIQNNFIYLYFTTQMADTQSQGRLVNVVQRYSLKGDTLQSKQILLGNIPASQNHDGGVLAFGPDQKLYITTGDAGQAELAQDTASLAGKILRINDDGSIPSDNPFNNEIWSYGHRNPQGIAWDEKGRLWSTEHGPSGLQSGRDELNLIVKGENYGWPTITGNESKAGMHSPIAQSGDNDTWAPAGLAYANSSLFFTGLRGQTLYQAKINSESSVQIVRHFAQKYGRLRAIFATNDALIFGTSNRDGRGNPTTNDDRLLQIPLSAFTN